MSQVTNALLTFSILEDEEARMAEVNEALDRVNLSAHAQRFEDVCDPSTHSYGGYKVFEAPLWMAAFNHLDSEVVLACAEKARWDNVGSVQLIARDEDDERFTVHTPTRNGPEGPLALRG